MIASLWASMGSFAQAGELKDAFYATPEAAIKHFMEGIAKRDISHSLQVSAANEIATKYNFKRMTRRLAAIIWGKNPSPTEYDMYQQLNRYALLAEMTESIRLLCFSLLAPDNDFTRPVMSPTEDMVNQLIESINPLGLAKLKLIRSDLAHPELNSKVAKNLAPEQIAPYGATDFTERLVLLELNGQKYYIGMRLFQYGKYWKIYQLQSLFANVGARAVKTTTEEYEAKLKG